MSDSFDMDSCSRKDILSKKIKKAIRCTTNTTEERLKKTIDVGLNERLIGKVHIFAVDNNGRPLMQLTLEIDWKRHLFHIREGEEPIDIGNGNWEEEIDFKLDKTIELFNDYVFSENLRTLWGVECARDVDRQFARRKLELIEYPITSNDNDDGKGRVYRWKLGWLDEMDLEVKKY